MVCHYSFMKQNQINRVIGLVRKTGDRVVVLDQETEDVLVMMRLDEYENLMDFALPSGEDGPLPDFEQWDEESDDAVEESPKTVVPVQSPPPKTEKKLEFNEDWVAPVGSIAPEEDLSDVPEDEEEPRFYLEAVE